MQLQHACFILCLLLGFSSSGQYAFGDFNLSDSAEVWFDQKIGLQAHDIFTGVYESLEQRPAIDQVSWGESIWMVGDVSYRGEVFRKIYLFYDLERDALLIKNHLNSAYLDQPIRLNQQQVSWFQIEGDRFVWKSFSVPNVAAGFYHELFNSASFEMYAKRKKVRELDVNAVRLSGDDSFYLVIDGAVKRVTRPSSFYKLYPDLKRELKPVFKSLRIRKLEQASTSQLKQLARRCAPIITPS